VSLARLAAAVAPRIALAMALLLGCGGRAARFVGYEDLVETRASAALEERGVSGPVAVAPFSLGSALQREVAPDDAAVRAAAAQVARHVADALAQRGLEVIPPDELAAALAPSAAAASLDPRGLADAAHRSFGAGELLTGELLRYRERRGGAAGSTSPAAVTFDVVLHAAPGGAPLWRARFDEVQTALLRNVVHASRYPGRGTRWLSADEIARWGAEAVAAALPAHPREGESPASVGAPGREPR
jgi:hypothetical protein